MNRSATGADGWGGGGKRDLRFDTIRGGLLVVMALNHIDSDFRMLLDQPLGFVTSAEGFVFLSGVLAGRIDHACSDAGELIARARKRALRAYLWHAVALLGAWLWVQGWLACDQPTPWRLPFLFHSAPWTGLASGLTLLYQPGLLDILPMYVGFPFIGALMIRMHRRGWAVWAWVGSGAVWALNHWLLPASPIEWRFINTGAFHFLSWQWLFATGVLLGAEPKWEREALHNPKRWTLLAAVAGVIFLWAARRPELPKWWDDDTLRMLTGKTSLAALRMLNFGLIAYLLAVLGSCRPRLLAFAPLAMLGRHSLPVFTASIWSAQICLSFPDAADSWAGRMIETVLTIAGIVLTAITCEAYSRRRNVVKRAAPLAEATPRAA